MTEPPCNCIRCTLNRCFDQWCDAQPEGSVDQKEVANLVVKFLGDVIVGMPMFDNLRPVRILVTGKAQEDADAAPRIN